MTQADLVRLFFAKGEKPTYWKYCFNKQCPLADECAHQLSVAYKDPEQTDGYSIFPDAYQDGKCKHFHQMKLTKMAYGLEKILDELKRILFRQQHILLPLQTGADCHRASTARVYLAMVQEPRIRAGKVRPLR